MATDEVEKREKRIPLLRAALVVSGVLAFYVASFSFVARVAFPLYLRWPHPRFDYWLYCPDSVVTLAEYVYWPLIRLLEPAGGRYWPDPAATGIKSLDEVSTVAWELMRRFPLVFFVAGWLAIAIVASRAVHLVRQRARRRLAMRLCACGYSLIGNTSGRCPECGRDADAAAKRLG